MEFKSGLDIRISVRESFNGWTGKSVVPASQKIEEWFDIEKFIKLINFSIAG
jgi:hypothetical protein